MMDPKKKRLLIVLAIGCPVVAWRLSALTKYFPSPAEAVSPADVEAVNRDPVAASSTSPLQFVASSELLQKIRNGPWGRDPFGLADVRNEPETIEASSAPVLTAPAAPVIQFRSVSRSRGIWIAVVGGSFVRVGDIIDSQYRVRAIGRGSITLESQGWQFNYELGANTPVVQPWKGAP